MTELAKVVMAGAPTVRAALMILYGQLERGGLATDEVRALELDAIGAVAGMIEAAWRESHESRRAVDGALDGVDRGNGARHAAGGRSG